MIVSWPAKIADKGGLRSQFHHVIDIAPTLLEVAGVQPPDVLNGIAQKAIDGVSLACTFADAQAPERHKTQVFEIGVNRGIYQNGWFASSIAFAPWEPNRTGFDIDKANWELYKIDDDFSQAHDLAAANPGKLRAMQDLWWAEAARNNILPLDWRAGERLSAELTGKPSLAGGRRTFVYEAAIGSAARGRRSRPEEQIVHHYRRGRDSGRRRGGEDLYAGRFHWRMGILPSARQAGSSPQSPRSRAFPVIRSPAAGPRW
jgi:hypothetical protein